MSNSSSNGPVGIVSSPLPILNDSGPLPRAPVQLGRMNPMPPSTRTPRASMLGSGVGITPAPNQPGPGGPARRLPVQPPVTGPCGVGMLAYLLASIAETVVEGCELIP